MFDIVPFTSDHIEPATRLLGSRYHADNDKVKNEVLTSFNRPGTIGAAALQQNSLKAFVLGHKNISTVMGRSAWIGFSGYASVVSPDVYRELYAVLAGQWVNQGIFTHQVMISAADRPLLDVWFSLGFGQQQAYGTLKLADFPLVPSVSPDIQVRLAQPSDQAAFYRMGANTMRHQMLSPTFAPSPPEAIKENQEGLASLVSDPDWKLWVALKDGQVVGYQALTPAQPDMMIPPNAIELVSAGTISGMRGTGVGRALCAASLTDARQAGADYCVIDWRTTNLQASRFWPRVGFIPTVYRLARNIDSRIAWAAH